MGWYIIHSETCRDSQTSVFSSCCTEELEIHGVLVIYPYEFIIVHPFTFPFPVKNHEGKLKTFEGASLGEKYLPFHRA